MSTLSKTIIHSVLLAALAACVRPAYSGSVSTTGPQSAPTAAVAPAASRRSSLQPLTRLPNVGRAGSRIAAPVLVIPAREMSSETYDRIVEDLSIMSRILEKNFAAAPELYDALGREVGALQQILQLELSGYASSREGDPMLPRIVRSSGGRCKPLYIGGYGAVFSLHVGFPLVPPPEAPQQKPTAGGTDLVWAAAQRELADPEGAARRRRAGSQREPYNAEAVEGLQNALTAAFKHATNIRDLEPEAWLTILVQGPASTAPSPQQEHLNQFQQKQIYDEAFSSIYGGQDQREQGRTLMTLRVQKADVDRFAKGELDETQFQQRVQITTR